MKLFLFTSLLLFSFNLFSQKKLPTKQIQIIGGYCRHGSGDLNGVLFGAEYIKYLNRRMAFGFNLKGAINDGQETLIVNSPSGTTDNSIHFTTAGAQLGIDGRYSLVRTAEHEFIVALGFFGRYQSASPPGGYSLYFPSQTSVPYILVGFLNNGFKRETFAVGGLFQIQYNYTIKNKVSIGIQPGFQTDTNGDVIPHVVLTIGRRF